MEFHLLIFRWRSTKFVLLESTEEYGTFDVSFCRIDRYGHHATGEWVSSSWPLFGVCFYQHSFSTWADIYLVGQHFSIPRKRRSSPDDLPF